ncbi:MAG: hypothetical protein M3270_05300 [Thermoproteota archaeon]|nr:hypothetical protein [Thermoproteota archaeon]
MQNDNRIPRWLVENDPSWERTIDSDPGTLRWTKKGTHMQAICHPASIFCEIIGQKNEQQDNNIPDLTGRTYMERNSRSVSGIEDITKYLSSRYLNPGINRQQPLFGSRKASINEL